MLYFSQKFLLRKNKRVFKESRMKESIIAAIFLVS